MQIAPSRGERLFEQLLAEGQVVSAGMFLVEGVCIANAPNALAKFYYPIKIFQNNKPLRV
jgi:hypothetical protein